MKPEDGGPAFPHDARDMGKSAANGMSLRDYFAGQALPAVYAACDLRAEGDRRSPRTVAKVAYAVADAMLAERAGSQS